MPKAHEIQVLPVYTMPLTSNIGTNFRARPLRQWRKQYQPIAPLSNHRNASVGMPMDRPGGASKSETNDSYCQACQGAATLRTDIFQDSPCKSCEPIINNTRFKDINYTDTPAYLQSRCSTYTQQLSTTSEPAVIYFTDEGRPTNPSDSPTGSQIRATRDCNETKKCNNTVIYKPNNLQYAQQGGVSSSSRISRLKYNTLNNNGAAFNSAAGAVNINAGRYQVEPSPAYYTKYKPEPNACLRKSGDKNLCVN
jgi:hypothetical protein